MSAITLGFPEFEARLEEIRTRLNRLCLQDAFCTTASAILLAASVVLVTAFVSSPETFIWVTRLAVAVLIASIVATTWRVRANWLDLEKTARFIDSKASLDARVATMLAHPKPQEASATRSILLWQIFEMGPRWEMERMAPRSIRRPAVALLFSFLVCATVLLLLPEEPTPPTPEATTATGFLTGESDETGRSGKILSGSSLTNVQEQRLKQAGGDLNQSPTSAGSGGSDGNKFSARATTERVGTETAADDGAERAPEGEIDRGDGERADPEADRADRDGDEPEPPAESARAQDPSRPAPKKHAPKHAPTPQLPGTSRAEPGSQRGNRKKSGSGSQAARDPRLGKSGTSRGLLGEKGSGPPNPRDNTAPPMLIELKAFAANVVPQMEPQGEGPDSSDVVTGDGPDAEAAPLAERQTPDSHLIRSAITRLHEDLIRDLFTPNE